MLGCTLRHKIFASMMALNDSSPCRRSQQCDAATTNSSGLEDFLELAGRLASIAHKAKNHILLCMH